MLKDSITFFFIGLCIGIPAVALFGHDPLAVALGCFFGRVLEELFSKKEGTS